MFLNFTQNRVEYFGNYIFVGEKYYFLAVDYNGSLNAYTKEPFKASKMWMNPNGGEHIFIGQVELKDVKWDATLQPIDSTTSSIAHAPKAEPIIEPAIESEPVSFYAVVSGVVNWEGKLDVEYRRSLKTPPNTLQQGEVAIRVSLDLPKSMFTQAIPEVKAVVRNLPNFSDSIKLTAEKGTW